MSALPLIVLVVLFVGLILFTSRNRRRQAAAASAQADRIGVGADVMTTSGLHGTVVARNDDGTVQLSIAPGVEVRWEVAALRDVASLPDRYRHAQAAPEADGAGGAGDATGAAEPGVQLHKDE